MKPSGQTNYSKIPSQTNRAVASNVMQPTGAPLPRPRMGKAVSEMYPATNVANPSRTDARGVSGNRGANGDKKLDEALKEIADLKEQLKAKDKIIERQRSDVTKLRKENFELKSQLQQNGRSEESSGPDRDTLRQIEMAMRM